MLRKQTLADQDAVASLYSTTFLYNRVLRPPSESWLTWQVGALRLTTYEALTRIDGADEMKAITREQFDTMFNVSLAAIVLLPPLLIAGGLALLASLVLGGGGAPDADAVMEGLGGRLESADGSIVIPASAAEVKQPLLQLFDWRTASAVLRRYYEP